MKIFEDLIGGTIILIAIYIGTVQLCRVVARGLAKPEKPDTSNQKDKE